MGSSPRIALVFDDEAQRRRFAEHVSPATRVSHIPGGSELVRLAAARSLDVAVVGVLNRTDQLLPSALRELSTIAPEVAIVGVFETSRPSLDEAADLAQEIPAMGFVSRPGARFDYLARRRSPGSPSPTFTSVLLNCMKRLPLFGPARPFAMLQAPASRAPSRTSTGSTPTPTNGSTPTLSPPTGRCRTKPSSIHPSGSSRMLRRHTSTLPLRPSPSLPANADCAPLCAKAVGGCCSADSAAMSC